MPFGQFIIGPPGSGKTTYCFGMEQFLTSLKRAPIIVNLDPANEINIPYKCEIDVRSLVCLKNVMKEFKLGPNGGLLYCMEYLSENINWLISKLKESGVHSHYFLFDLPGQIELYTTHNCVKNILKQIEKQLNFRITIVNLIDSIYCLDPFKYISTLIVSLSTMIYLEYPHINVLSKIDLVKKKNNTNSENDSDGEMCNDLLFDISYYSEVQNLKYLIQNDKSKFKKLNEALISVIENYDNVCFKTLDISDKESIYDVLKVVDKANGYIFGTLENLQDVVVNDEFFK